MDGDDDMIMIIVGDDENEENKKNVSPPIVLKEEPVDDIDGTVFDPELILETAELYGEYVNLVNEEYTDCEYLDDDIETAEKQKPLTTDLVKRRNRKRAVSPSDSDEDDDEYPEPQIDLPRQSYIDQLRKNFPKMRKDDDYLVTHLTEIMKNVKPPIPPIDFCVSTADKQLRCAYCKTVCPTLPMACRHYQKKHGSRYLSCYACGATYRCTTGLYKHEKRCLSDNALLVLKARGQYLGRKGRTRPYLTRNKFEPWHIKKDKETKKRYYCSQCTASFSHKDALTGHEYMHNGIRPYQCDQCPVAYTSSLALRRHLVKHSDIQHMCDVCGRSFKAKTTLVVHMNTHLPQRKYPCDRCERRFAQKSALQHHINRDHLNIPPPLACAACPKRFPRISNLKAHMKAKHGLTLMTRKMFFKALPSMKEAELKKATLVFNQLENDVVTAPVSEFVTAPVGESIFNKKGNIRTNEDHDPDISEDDIPEETVPEGNHSTTKVIIEMLHDENDTHSTVDNVMIQENTKDTHSVVENTMIQEHTLDEDIKEEIEDTIDTSNVERVNEKVPTKEAIKTTIPERCELEFVKLIAKTNAKSEKDKRDRYKSPKIDLSITRMHENIKAITGRGRSMPLVSDEGNESAPCLRKVNNTVTELTVGTMAKEVANVINKNAGKVCKNDDETPAKTDASVVKGEHINAAPSKIATQISKVKTVPPKIVSNIQTRSETLKNAPIPMQTRSKKTHIKGEKEREKRKGLLKK